MVFLFFSEILYNPKSSVFIHLTMTTTLSRFNTLFEPKILQRGRNYYHQGLVKQLKNSEHWTARVQGSHSYRVSIELRPKGSDDYYIEDMQCNCEYWDYCKHMVAVLYQLQNMGREIEVIYNEQDERIKTIHQQLQTSSKETLYDFIISLSKKQSFIFDEWQLWFNQHHIIPNTCSQNQSSEMKDKQIQTLLHQRIHDILDEKISITLDDDYYYDEWYFDEEVKQFNELCQEFKHQPQYTIEIIFYWAEQCFEYFNEFYSEELTESIQTGCSLLGEIIFQEQAYHLDWDTIQKYSIKNTEYVQVILERLENLFDIHLCHANASTMLLLVRFQFDILLSISPDNALNSLDNILTQFKDTPYEFEKAILFKSNVLAYLNETNQLLQLLNQYSHLPKIRERLIEYALKHQDITFAIKLIEDGIQLAKQQHYHGIIYQWQCKLFELAQKAQKVELMRTTAQNLAFYYHTDINEFYFKHWKNTFDQDSWLLVRQKYQQQLKQEISKSINNSSNKINQLAQFYMLEQQEQELIELIQCYPSITLLEKYGLILTKHKNDWFGQIFLKLLQDKIITLSERKAYRQFAVDIQSFVATYPLLQTIVQTQINQWIQHYQKSPNRRPALVEELSNIKWSQA